MRYDIKVTKTNHSRIAEVDFDNLPFGRVFSDHMFIADYKDGAWFDLRIVPFEDIPMHPATSALHYGQSIFEGLKAYRSDSDDVQIFRPTKNAERLNLSAQRMAMPELPTDLFMQGLDTLVTLDQAWVPKSEGSSLYIRPFMFATDDYVGIKASDTYRFIIFTCPVQAYYSEAVKVLISDKHVRAFPGGTGEAKAAGNYAATLQPVMAARKNGYDQILWTDGYEFKYLQEIGTMNVFLQIDGKLVTPKLNGTILNGITRDSILQLMEDRGTPAEVRDISVDEVYEAYRNGQLNDAFGAGTAATISHISHMGYKGERLELPSIESRTLSHELKQELEDIKLSRTADSHGWVHRVGETVTA
ncbi:branched-chain amino acid aminotransferase [soil metagenome]